MNSRPVRLAAATALPVQNTSPFFQELAARPEVDLTVLYGSTLGAENAFDPEMGINISWDVPLFDGYDYKVVGTIARPEVASGWKLLSPAVYRELSSKKYDAAIVFGWGSWFDRSAIAACIAHSIPYFLCGDATPIYPETPLKGAAKHLMVGMICRRAAGCLYAGTLQRIFYERMGVPSERLFFHPYTVDNKRFSVAGEMARAERDRVREEFGLPTGLPLIVFSGKLIPRKRPGDLLDAVARLQADGVECGVAFVGEGELRQDLESRADQLGLRDVYFLGFVNQLKIPEVLAACDVFSLPSAHDPRGTVVNEAMATGLPVVIAHGVGVWGFGDLVQHGETGFIHYTGDVGALAEDCLRPLVTDAALRRKMGNAGHDRISTWSIKERVDGLIDALATLRGRGGQNRPPSYEHPSDGG